MVLFFGLGSWWECWVILENGDATVSGHGCCWFLSGRDWGFLFFRRLILRDYCNSNGIAEGKPFVTIEHIL